MLPVGELRSEGLKGIEDLHTSSGAQHQRCENYAPMTRQKQLYLAALNIRSHALLSCPFLKMPRIKEKAVLLAH